MKRLTSLLVLLFLTAGYAFSQRASLDSITICIDPGHGGHNPDNDRHVIPDPGTDFWESESNFQKALLLKTLLEAKGATVILTRNTNDYPNDNLEPSLAARVQLANVFQSSTARSAIGLPEEVTLFDCSTVFRCPLTTATSSSTSTLTNDPGSACSKRAVARVACNEYPRN